MTAKESNQSFQNIFEEFKAWISGKNLLIPILVGCFVYSICICSIDDIQDYCYNPDFLFILVNSIWNWIYGFQKQQAVKDIIPQKPKINLSELPLINKESLKRNFEREKIALLIVSLLFLGVLVYHLVKWIKSICCSWNRNKTILQINSEGRWEYAPSLKRIEAAKSNKQ